MKLPFSLLPALFATVAAFAGEAVDSKKVIVPPEEDHWKLMLASPGWMAGVNGTVGVDGVNSHVDLGIKDLINKIDMAWATRGELSKGRFGVMGELVYMSLSDSLGVGGPVNKVDVRMDQYLADFSLRWRLVERDWGFVDAIGGVRYTNLYQSVHLQANDQAISETTDDIVDEVGRRLRERLDEVLTGDRFRNALAEAVKERITDKLETITGPEPKKRSLPIVALAHRPVTRLGREIDRLILRKEAELVRTTLATERAAVEADREALRAATEAARAAAQARAAALRVTVNERIATAKKQLESEIEKKLHTTLNQSVALDYAWWDPYVGVRVRYNVTPAIYLQARGDIGGFGVGSDLMWQLEGAMGFQLTHRIFAELGYRALSFDYSSGGFTYDVITHGAQVTVGMDF